MPGTYKVDVKLGGVAIVGSPFIVKSYDKSKVSVFGLSDSVVNKSTIFTGSTASFSTIVSCIVQSSQLAAEL